MPITAFNSFTDGLAPSRRSREHFVTNLDLEDGRRWVPYADGVWLQPCHFNVTSGGFSVVLKRVPGAMLGTHYHVGTVRGYTMRGHFVQRDIKGANILIELDGRVLVSDFGIARAMTENSLTASGMVSGTPNFMSPEQCGGQKVGPQSDQYSLGIRGFQMLTGQLPFEADSIMGIIQHHYMTPPPDLRQVREGVPEELLAVMYRALAKKPEERFATTAEMAEALESVPQTPEEKRESLAMLKALAQGEPIAQVRTGSLPPLSLTAANSSRK